jgi:hypothetical protein
LVRLRCEAPPPRNGVWIGAVWRRFCLGVGPPSGIFPAPSGVRFAYVGGKGERKASNRQALPECSYIWGNPGYRSASGCPVAVQWSPQSKTQDQWSSRASRTSGPPGPAIPYDCYPVPPCMRLLLDTRCIGKTPEKTSTVLAGGLPGATSLIACAWAATLFNRAPGKIVLFMFASGALFKKYGSEASHSCSARTAESRTLARPYSTIAGHRRSPQRTRSYATPNTYIEMLNSYTYHAHMIS